jgi:hypothetical protein
MTPSNPAVQIWMNGLDPTLTSVNTGQQSRPRHIFNRDPLLSPYPTRSPSAESKSDFYLFLFQKSDSLFTELPSRAYFLHTFSVLDLILVLFVSV